VNQQPAVESAIKAYLSAHLASSLAKGLGWYASVAGTKGRRVVPVSGLLTPGDY
jgi:hypothetical protein